MLLVVYWLRINCTIYLMRNEVHNLPDWYKSKRQRFFNLNLGPKNNRRNHEGNCSYASWPMWQSDRREGKLIYLQYIVK